MKQSADDYKNIVEINHGLTYNFTERINSQNGDAVAKDLEDFITQA